jgi:zinc/manganese transport system substrate-binding protein
VPVLRATDHVDIIAPRDQDPERVGPGPEEHADGEIGDPHFWLDPLRMRDVVLALAAAFAEAGIDVGGRAQLVAAELESLDAEISAMLSAVPDVQRKLVTGHGSLAYLADRYAFEVIGAVVPGVTTSGEASARDIADLTASIREEGVRAVFSDIGTPASIARSVALDTGARVVELQLARLPEDGTYADLLLDIAGSIRDALSD